MERFLLNSNSEDSVRHVRQFHFADGKIVGAVTHVCVNDPTGFSTIHKDITERL